MKRYSEVEIGFYDETLHGWSIETWETTDKNEESVVIGHINLSGDIEMKEDVLKEEPQIQEAICRFMNNKVFSKKDSEKITEELLCVIKNVVRDRKERLKVISSNKVRTYGIENVTILEKEVICAGLIGEESGFIITSDTSEKEIKRLVKWILAHISEVVGGEYVIVY